MKHVISNLSLALVSLMTCSLISSCAIGSQKTDAASSGERSRLYRPVNGAWSGHWDPDRKHAEDHLRAHNKQNGVSGGVVEYN